MKKIEYMTPEMEVVKINMSINVLLSTSSNDTPGITDEEEDDDNGAG